jgi:Ca-activated chloride channel homolog
MNFLTPLAFAGLAVSIPIILMYMLRLRRREVNISSTFLWSQVLQDTEANTPWQKLRRNLLLLLQLLILLLIVLALARPFITVDAVSAGQITLLLDASASMNATDGAGGTRFETARDRAIDIIDTLSDSDRMTVIRVAGVPEVLASATSDKNVLRAAVQQAEPTQAESDWGAALNLAAAGSAAAEDFAIVIIGDGGLPVNAGLQGIAGDVRYIPVGTTDQNVAITALSTDRQAGRPPELFAQITNYSTTPAEVTFALRVDGERFEATNLSLPANAELPIISAALPDDFQTLTATLTQRVDSDLTDTLPTDDTAYATTGNSQGRRVLIVTDGNVFLERVFGSLPTINAVRAEPNANIPEGFDLYVFDGTLPATLPAGDLMFINPPANTEFFTLGGFLEEPETVRVVDPADPRVSFVDQGTFSFLRVRRVTAADWARPLITADDAPVLLAGETDGRQIALLPFSLSETDLPLQITWPILVANLAEWFTPRAVIDVTASITIGDALTIRPPFEADAIRVTAPDGGTTTLEVRRDEVVFAGATIPGFYTLELLQDQAVIGQQTFAVNLFSPAESNITPVPQDALTIQGITVNPPQGEERGQRELWPFVALAALVVLLIEWYAYYRRLRVPTVFRPARGTA